jgi:hypothetical protein
MHEDVCRLRWRRFADREGGRAGTHIVAGSWDRKSGTPPRFPCRPLLTFHVVGVKAKSLPLERD